MMRVTKMVTLIYFSCILEIRLITAYSLQYGKVNTQP